MAKTKTPSKNKVKIEKNTLDHVLDDQQIRSSLQFGDYRLPDSDSETDDVREVNITIDTDTAPREHKAMGWLRELPDFRDYNIHTDMSEVSDRRKALGVKKTIKTMANEIGVLKASRLPKSANLTQWFSPVEDQGSIGSCTANAGVGILEYFERRAFNNHIDASRLFLYKATRNLLNWKGDTGAYLRTTMQALTVFGVCPERYWPYRIKGYDAEPTAFCYSFAQSYQSISYFRHDNYGVTPQQILNSIKTWIAAGIPAMFGFTCYSSMDQANADGMIPFPTRGEKNEGGHAVVAAGYDDNKIITNRNNNSKTKGAFLIRNSWGTSWGDRGYGWLPYEYALRQLAVDWWSLIKAEWVDTKKFEIE